MQEREQLLFLCDGNSTNSIIIKAVMNNKGCPHSKLPRIVDMFAIFLCLAFLTSCSSSNPSPTETKLSPGSISLTGGGSTFSSVLFDRWFTVYHDSHPETFIKYASVGSGEGVRRYIGNGVPTDERVDFGASDSAMSDAELAQTRESPEGLEHDQLGRIDQFILFTHFHEEVAFGGCSLTS